MDGWLADSVAVGRRIEKRGQHKMEGTGWQGWWAKDSGLKESNTIFPSYYYPIHMAKWYQAPQNQSVGIGNP